MFVNAFNYGLSECVEDTEMEFTELLFNTKMKSSKHEREKKKTGVEEKPEEILNKVWKTFLHELVEHHPHILQNVHTYKEDLQTALVCTLSNYKLIEDETEHIAVTTTQQTTTQDHHEMSMHHHHHHRSHKHHK